MPFSSNVFNKSFKGSDKRAAAASLVERLRPARSLPVTVSLSFGHTPERGTSPSRETEHEKALSCCCKDKAFC